METTPAGTTFVPVLQLEGVTRSFRQGDRDITVLRGVNAALWPGQAVAMVGPSGAGKSTLLHIAGLLEAPTSGRVLVNGRDCATLSEADRTRMRRREIGFVYQFHQLLPEFSALENVVIPQLIQGHSRKTAEARAMTLLSGLGLGERAEHRPAELSGGEQQRTAICRGLANSPRLLLADEPTGNLDPHTSEHVFRELLDLIHRQGLAALIATHNMQLAKRMDRVLQMHEGQLVEIAPASIG
ncbi:ABC transporter [Hyphomicrobium methylovorum]|uniref:ABC transporter ATP-binding protein n=1 Tax=Hyphomicrobium methylovorum TaxID=84 RepID=UPI0015E725FC|nr:ABC transporter ATP-binding protein [Hyphomicrobium methylovorum]MBA2125131.1 ABC transporter [Hyphomicrobium methylovorum]